MFLFLGPETSIFGFRASFLGSEPSKTARFRREDLFSEIESFWGARGVEIRPFPFQKKKHF